MGNIFSDNLRIELYKWSSAEFPEEYALMYTSLVEKSRFSTFRLSIKPQKVLLKLADFLCDDHPVRLHMEIIAEKDNGYFNYRVVKVVENGTSQQEIPLRNGVVFHYLSGKRAGCWNVTPHGRNYSSVNRMTWEVLHSYAIGVKTHIRFYVNIECDIVNGLSAKFSGPFKCEGLIFETKSGSLIQHKINGEPPANINRIVESHFTGNQFVLFDQGKGSSFKGGQDIFSKLYQFNTYNSGVFNGDQNGSFDFRQFSEHLK